MTKFLFGQLNPNRTSTSTTFRAPFTKLSANKTQQYCFMYVMEYSEQNVARQHSTNSRRILTTWPVLAATPHRLYESFSRKTNGCASATHEQPTTLYEKRRTTEESRMNAGKKR